MTLRGFGAGERVALVLMECQLGMIGEEAAAAGSGLAKHAIERRMVDNAAGLVHRFRQLRLPVVHCTFNPRRDMAGTSINTPLFVRRFKARSLEPDGTLDDNPIHPALGPEPGDFVISRLHGLEAFHDTELDAILRTLRTTTMVLCGVSTNIGIPGTALGGLNRGYNVVMPEDCIAGAWPEAHQFMVEHTLNLLGTVTTSDDVLDALADH